MTPFLTYEPLTPEYADPVIIRITGQRERGFETQQWNGIWIVSALFPAYSARQFFCRGQFTTQDTKDIQIPLADWPLVKAAIAELNEAKKEKDMKEDRYEFPLSEWECTLPALEHPEPKLTVTRKKPKVKVEFVCKDVGCGSHNNVLDFREHGKYRLVQFKVTGWNGKLATEQDLRVLSLEAGFELRLSSFNKTFSRKWGHAPTEVYISLDALDKWSAPVLLPEEIYTRLPEITKALEDRANGGES